MKMKEIMEKIIAFIKKLFGITNPKPIGNKIDLNSLGYKLKFIENFSNSIDWNLWSWREPWSGDQDTQKGNTVWRQDCVKNDYPNILHLIANRDTNSPTNSCGLISSHKFLNVLYGYISITAKVPPKGFLYFPAIWMYWKQGWQPEIDILECMGNDSKSLTFTHHWVGTDGNDVSEGKTCKWDSIDFSNDYHEYSIEWTPTKLTWYVDKLPYYSTTNQIPNVELFLICNIQVGYPAFTHLYTPNEVPQNFDIKKIEIYQK